MDQFLDGLEKRMHPAQWNAFTRDQDIARRTLVARVPIVFETHENDDYNRRAFLPIVVQNYQPPEQGLNWANLRVLYLDVTTATEVVTSRRRRTILQMQARPLVDQSPAAADAA